MIRLRRVNSGSRPPPHVWGPLLGDPFGCVVCQFSVSFGAPFPVPEVAAYDQRAPSWSSSYPCCCCASFAEPRQVAAPTRGSYGDFAVGEDACSCAGASFVGADGWGKDPVVSDASQPELAFSKGGAPLLVDPVADKTVLLSAYDVRPVVA